MIARYWTAWVTDDDEPFYVAHFETAVLPTLRQVEGYAGARLLERETKDGVEIIVITFWQSLRAIAGFAGRDVEKAVVEDCIVPLLQRYDRRVKHYEVVTEDEAWNLYPYT